jgi:hypothetical protein
MLVRTIRRIARTAAIALAALTLATWTAQPAIVHALEPDEDTPAKTVEMTNQKQEAKETPVTTEDKDLVSVPLGQAVAPEATTQEETETSNGGDKITASSTLSEPLSQAPAEDSTTNSVTATTDTSLHNTIESDATSGDATGAQNTTVGDISTGDAVAMATLINMILSNIQLADGQDPLVFVYEVLGDVAGNLLIDPEALATAGNASPSSLSPEQQELQSQSTASINNTLNLNAKSGDATAHQNTTVGDVSTGDAAAIANVINLINPLLLRKPLPQAIPQRNTPAYE